MKCRVEWKGYAREWAVVNHGHQVIRDGFKTENDAENWATENGYEL